MRRTVGTRRARPGPGRGGRLAHVLIALLLVGLGSGLAVPLGPAAPIATAAPRPVVAPVNWSPCASDSRFDCATYRVPLDHARPNGAAIALALTRRPADDPTNKIGSLFLNPGGPGAAGIQFAQGASQLAFNAEVRRRFDIVGFDPRGVGASAPIQCFATDGEYERVLGPALSMPIGAAEETRTLTAYRSYTEACRRNGGPLLQYLSTLNVVKDLDLLRQAVGDRQLTYAGYSYGTLIGATYAAVFPGRSRALLLDGMVDPEQRMQRSVANELDRAGGFEVALAGFLDSCAVAGARCRFAGGTAAATRQKFDALRERLRQGPVRSEDGSVTISDATTEVARSLYDASQFPYLGDYLQRLHESAFPAAAARTQRSAGRGTDRLRVRAPEAEYTYNNDDIERAVNCVDKRLPRPQALWRPLVAQFERAHRTFGRWEVYGSIPCATWPVVTNDRYPGPWNTPRTNPVLIVGNYYDPPTRYLFAQRAVRELGRARLLSLDGFGHTAILGSACINDRVSTYLLSQTLPPEGTVCRPDRQPFASPTPAQQRTERARAALLNLMSE